MRMCGMGRKLYVERARVRVSWLMEKRMGGLVRETSGALAGFARVAGCTIRGGARR